MIFEPRTGRATHSPLDREGALWRELRIEAASAIGTIGQLRGCRGLEGSGNVGIDVKSGQGLPDQTEGGGDRIHRARAGIIGIGSIDKSILDGEGYMVVARASHRQKIFHQGNAYLQIGADRDYILLLIE